LPHWQECTIKNRPSYFRYPTKLTSSSESNTQNPIVLVSSIIDPSADYQAYAEMILLFKK